MFHNIPWYSIMLHNIPWYFMAILVLSIGNEIWFSLQGSSAPSPASRQSGPSASLRQRHFCWRAGCWHRWASSKKGISLSQSVYSNFHEFQVYKLVFSMLFPKAFFQTKTCWKSGTAPGIGKLIFEDLSKTAALTPPLALWLVSSCNVEKPIWYTYFSGMVYRLPPYTTHKNCHLEDGWLLGVPRSSRLILTERRPGKWMTRKKTSPWMAIFNHQQPQVIAI